MPNYYTTPLNPVFPRGRFFFIRKPIKLLIKHERWHRVAEILKLSKAAKQRLEWIICYETKTQGNTSLTCYHFGISRKTFYKWYNQFDEKDLRTLEDRPKAPKNVRQKEITPLEESRIIALRREYIRYGKLKLKILYENLYQEEISSWKIQYTIENHNLYYHPQKTAKIRRKRQRAQKKKRITELKKRHPPGFLICLDAIVIYWNGLKRYVFTAIDSVSKVSFARMYSTKSSYSAQDFLIRLNYVLEDRIVNLQTDNGSEFEKYFRQACQKLNIERYYNRPRTPKDNPINERFNRILKEEFIDLGNLTFNLEEFNQKLTEWLIEYNFNRPHQTLGYSTPIQFSQKRLKVLPMWSSRTSF